MGQNCKIMKFPRLVIGNIADLQSKKKRSDRSYSVSSYSDEKGKSAKSLNETENLFSRMVPGTV